MTRSVNGCSLRYICQREASRAHHGRCKQGLKHPVAGFGVSDRGRVVPFCDTPGERSRQEQYRAKCQGELGVQCPPAHVPAMCEKRQEYRESEAADEDSKHHWYQDPVVAGEGRQAAFMQHEACIVE